MADKPTIIWMTDSGELFYERPKPTKKDPGEFMTPYIVGEVVKKKIAASKNVTGITILNHISRTFDDYVFFGVDFNGHPLTEEQAALATISAVRNSLESLVAKMERNIVKQNGHIKS